MRTSLVVVALAAAGLFWASAAAQQETRPTPGPGSGTMNVRGTVDIGNVPSVAAAQQGNWRVAVSSAPPVAVAGPEFLKKGSRYVIAWPGADPRAVTVVLVGQNGWVQVEFPDGGGRQRWVNLATAQSVEDAR